MGAQTHCNFLVLVVFTSDFRKKKPRNMADKYRTAETTNASNYELSLENTRAEVDNVVGTMRRNIDSVMERGTNLDDLNVRSANLQASSGQFQQQAGQIKKKQWWNNFKWWIILIVGVMLLILIIALTTVYRPNKNPPPTQPPATVAS